MSTQKLEGCTEEYGYCFLYDCPNESNCHIRDCTVDECLCAICMDSTAKCKCKQCNNQKTFPDACTWKEDCGLKEIYR